RDDNFLNDERADTLMLRLLAHTDEPQHALPPADIVTRTARRLPSVPPALAARRAARQRMVRLTLIAAVTVVLALVALVSLAGVFGGDPRLALLFGDG